MLLRPHVRPARHSVSPSGTPLGRSSRARFQDPSPCLTNKVVATLSSAGTTCLLSRRSDRAIREYHCRYEHTSVAAHAIGRRLSNSWAFAPRPAVFAWSPHATLRFVRPAEGPCTRPAPPPCRSAQEGPYHLLGAPPRPVWARLPPDGARTRDPAEHASRLLMLWLLQPTPKRRCRSRRGSSAPAFVRRTAR